MKEVEDNFRKCNNMTQDQYLAFNNYIFVTMFNVISHVHLSF